MPQIRKIEDPPGLPFTREFAKNKSGWLELRKKSIGGSEAAAAIGLSPYQTTEELWELKTGRRRPDDLSKNEAVIYGTKAERPIAELFALDYPEYDLYRKNNMTLRSKHLKYLTYSPDGELIAADGTRGLLEIKTTTIRHGRQWDDWNEQVPQHYFCQIMHGLLVTGYQFVILRAQIKSTWHGKDRIEVRDYAFQREDHIDDLKALLSGLMKFWPHVEKDERPPLILPEI